MKTVSTPITSAVYLGPLSHPGNKEEEMGHHVVKDPVRRNL